MAGGVLQGLQSVIGDLARPSQGQARSTQYLVPSVSNIMGMSPDDLFRTQPHLRTVITFVARNIAQLGLQTFQRVSDTDRRRITDDPIAMLLRKPNPHMTGYDLIYNLVADLKLYDVAIWAIARSAVTESGWVLYPIPQPWVQYTYGGNAWAPMGMVLQRPGGVSAQQYMENAPGKTPQFLLFHGYSPSDPGGWSSPVEALKDVLAEQVEAWRYRKQIWKRGGRVGTYLTRPAEAPEWSADARTRFKRDWKSKWTGYDGASAGGTPLLEDGMELRSTRFNAREEEWSEVARLSLSTVAGVYHVNPTMVGVLDNANYSNVKEFKQMLYTDTLGPDTAMIEARVNEFLVPIISPGKGIYEEFNIAEKLQGSFEDQANLISTSTGAPWMTRNEARGRFNLPALTGGDGLVVPLNVLTGGQASPRDSASQNRRAPQHVATKAPEDEPDPEIPVLLSQPTPDSVQVKARPRPRDQKLAEAALGGFFIRQADVVLSRLGAKAPGYWDEKRWNTELADTLYDLAMEITAQVGPETLRALGIDPDKYDAGQTRKFLKAVAVSRAGAINATTLAQLQDAIGTEPQDDVETSTPQGVFDQAKGSRLAEASVALTTTFTAFAVGESVKQINRPGSTKTWRVNSGNPRSAHLAMDGETVLVRDTFSNGADWPGDAVLGVDGIAGCMCSVEMTLY